MRTILDDITAMEQGERDVFDAYFNALQANAFLLGVVGMLTAMHALHEARLGGGGSFSGKERPNGPD